MLVAYIHAIHLSQPTGNEPCLPKYFIVRVSIG